MLALKQIARQHSAVKIEAHAQSGAGRTPDKLAWSRSKSVGVDSVRGLQRSSSTLVLNDDNMGSSLARTRSEKDVSELNGHASHLSTMTGYSPGPGPLHIAAK